MIEVDITTLIESCYTAALDHSFWPQVLNRVAASLGAYGSVVVPQDERRATECLASDSLAEANADYGTGWWRLDPWDKAAHAFLHRPGLVLRDSDLLTDEDKRSNPFFQEFCRRHRIGDFAACYFKDQRDGRAYSVSIFRDPRLGLYTAEEVQRLGVVTPHLARAFTLSAALSEARDHARGLIAGLERLSFGTIVLDGLCRARDINLTAQRLLRGYLRLDGDRRLHPLCSGDRERFERLLAAALPGGNGPGGGSMMLRPFGEGRPLLVEAVPLRSAEIALVAVGMRRGGVLLMLHDLFAPATPEIEELLMQLGLSRAEARLAQLVGRGHSPRAAASALQIAEGTARVHLRSCFSKLGIVRQTELAVLVTRLDSLTSRRVVD